MKKLSLSVLCLFLAFQLAQGEEKPASESIKIVIELNKQPEEGNLLNEAGWQAIVDSAVAVAQQCQDCTERTLDGVVDNVCECIKDMAQTMKTNPCAKGSISLTIQDSESGVAGSVRKK